MERVVTRYRAEGVAYRTLHDGQAFSLTARTRRSYSCALRHVSLEY